MTTKVFLIISICVCFFSYPAISQNTISGRVIDAQTGDPISFASIQIENIGLSTISSINGIFNIKSIDGNKSLKISFPGYISENITIKDSVNPLIKLIPAEKFSSSSIKTDPYNLLNKVISKAKKQKSDLSAKTLICTETYSNDKKLIESVEAFYQCKYSLSNGIKNLELKNGRMGVLSQNDMLFNSLETIKTFSKIDFFHYNKQLNYPISPLGLNKNLIKQCYNLEIKEIFRNGDKEYAILKFMPFKSSDEYFSGNVIINIDSYEIIQLTLNTMNIDLHPFFPFSEQDELSDINLNITVNFRKTNNGLLAYDHIKLNYNYKNSDNKSLKTNASIVFLDHSCKFTPIICDKNSFSTDYDMMMALPFNKEFWDNNSPLVINQYLKFNADHFSKNGILVNYYQDNGENSDSDNQLVLWDENIQLSWEDLYSTKSQEILQEINNPGKEYFLDIRIILDCNWINDTLSGCCQTVFNKSTSFCKLEKKPQYLEFINLQFDLVETVRRQMKQTIMKNNEKIDDILELQNIYDDYITRLKKTQYQLASEVQNGANIEKMKGWRVRINKELGK